jgi:hypothetical protein
MERGQGHEFVIHEHEHIPKGYYSDDEVVYVRKEEESLDDVQKLGSPARDPRKRRHIAEGSIGADFGSGSLDTAGAVDLDKFNSQSGWRSVSADRGRKRFRHTRSRSRSRASRPGHLAAIAGVGALAYAAGKKKQSSSSLLVEKQNRSRSRLKKRARSAKSDTAESDHESKRRGTQSRSRSTSSSKTVANVAPKACDGRDIVDFLLEQWTIPIG